MSRITVLGAGYMGSALAVVAADRGHEVDLWGTWLDDELVEPTLRGDPHPRLKLHLPDLVRVHPCAQLAEALRGAEVVACAVNSDGVLPVLERALPHLPDEAPLMSVSKGFLADASGRIRRISEVVREQLLRPAGKDRPWIAVGGPCKAMEVARKVSTSVLFGAEDERAGAACAELFEQDYYTVTRTTDVAGLETCSAFKNAYATASGICDGLQKQGHPEMFNTKALMFTQAIREIREMVLAMGGREQTALGLAGVGDLHVTAAAGRNRAYGERVGLGEPPELVAEQMRAAGELTEGYPALQTGWDLLGQLGPRAGLSAERFPLLTALHQTVYGGADPRAAVDRLRVVG